MLMPEKIGESFAFGARGGKAKLEIIHDRDAAARAAS